MLLDLLWCEDIIISLDDLGPSFLVAACIAACLYEVPEVNC